MGQLVRKDWQSPVLVLLESVYDGNRSDAIEAEAEVVLLFAQRIEPSKPGHFDVRDKCCTHPRYLAVVILGNYLLRAIDSFQEIPEGSSTFASDHPHRL